MHTGSRRCSVGAPLINQSSLSQSTRVTQVVSTAYSDYDSSESRCVSQMDGSNSASVATPASTVSAADIDMWSDVSDLSCYIALGCLHYTSPSPHLVGPIFDVEWVELLHHSLPDELRLIVGHEALRLLNAQWIRLLIYQPSTRIQSSSTVMRLYILPEDRNRRAIDRNSRSLRTALQRLLPKVDVSRMAWAADFSNTICQQFDPWATSENSSLYFLFNKLPSPAPNPASIKNRYARVAVQDLLESAASSAYEDYGEQPLVGLRTRLYPYQARSASLMVQREVAPQLQLDPRLETRTSPNGKTFYYGARDGCFLQEPRYYETSRGGILAETMGLGKTIICLAVILTTKGHYPSIPAAYFPSPPTRTNVGSLADMAAATISRHSVPARVLAEDSASSADLNFAFVKAAMDRNIAFYEIPYELPRMNRATKLPPPRQIVPCCGTLIVVPRNLLQQWISEISKHVIEGALKVLVVDSAAKRENRLPPSQVCDAVERCSDLPPPTDLMSFDVVLFTRNRFEQEIQDGTDAQGRKRGVGVNRVCQCPYIGATRIPDCTCFDSNSVYKSSLQKLHWLRIIIDEGHSFSSASSNAVLVSKQIQAERRWVVSGTPAKNLIGVEVDVSAPDPDATDVDVNKLRENTIEKRREFKLDNENIKATKALGSLAANFLMVRPWHDSGTVEKKIEWDDYVYRHEDPHRKTMSGFSTCFLRTLEGLVVKTRPEDVERDINLPPMRHSVVYLKPCWFDKMTANMFIQVLRTNAITSERSDTDYLFHKNSVKSRHSLIRNLRQSSFAWTGFTLDDVLSTIETGQKYLTKTDKTCSQQDFDDLTESSSVIEKLITSQAWTELSKAHEIGIAVQSWPTESEQAFALTYPTQPSMIGITQLLEGQIHVDSHLTSDEPTQGLAQVGYSAKERIEASTMETSSKRTDKFAQTMKAEVPTSRSGVAAAMTAEQQDIPLAMNSSPKRGILGANDCEKVDQDSVSPSRLKRKRRSMYMDHSITLPDDSTLKHSKAVGTTSAKLSYIIDKVIQHQSEEKILIFYDGDNAAYYIAQCLEMLHVNHRIYARTLDNAKRSAYVVAFNEDPDIRVLLIDVACGALGLNLNAASVVLIVNPINRPGIEAQAIKRAHRIGQTKRVLVETLILENTIEHAIFNRAKKMSRAQHLEAKELEDDAGIIEIIQKAQVLHIDPAEENSNDMFAKLNVPQQIFGRPGREKFHRYGRHATKLAERSKKKVKVALDLRKQVEDTKAEGGDQAQDAIVLTPIAQENSEVDTQTLADDEPITAS